ncbi:MAG: OmpH family outer membrane protein [Phycisphaerales bacterium]
MSTRSHRLSPAHLSILMLLVAAIAALALSARGGSAVAQPPAPAPSAAAARFATLDIYILVEKILLRPEFKKAQDDLAARWNPRLDALQRDLTRIEQDLQALAQNDPKFQAALRTGREKQDEYERAIQERQSEYEKLSSDQLAGAYAEARATADRIAEQRGYTHVFATRPPSRPMTTSTLGNTLQEFLARPVIKAPEGDDLTAAVAAELRIDLNAPDPAIATPAPTGMP